MAAELWRRDEINRRDGRSPGPQTREPARRGVWPWACVLVTVQRMSVCIWTQTVLKVERNNGIDAHFTVKVMSLGVGGGGELTLHKCGQAAVQSTPVYKLRLGSRFFPILSPMYFGLPCALSNTALLVVKAISLFLLTWGSYYSPGLYFLPRNSLLNHWILVNSPYAYKDRPSLTS